jgi:hypothetical protein
MPLNPAFGASAGAISTSPTRDACGIPVTPTPHPERPQERPYSPE